MANSIKIYTIGFTKKNAKQFFNLIKDAGIREVYDTRLNNISQLAGFAKRDDLAFFLDKVAGVSYRHALNLAPSQDILKRYKDGKIDWEEYAKSYIDIIKSRNVEKLYSADDLDGACLLCSESTPHRCHRRLAAEFFRHHLGESGIEIIHL